MGKYFTIISPGNKKVACLLARWSGNGECILEEAIIHFCDGFTDGEIEDLSKATKGVRETLEKLKEKTGISVHDVYIVIKSSSIKLISSSGMLLLSKYGREISAIDVKKCLNIASTIKMSLHSESIHKIVRDFSVDDQTGISNPVNMEGVRLACDVNLITISSPAINNFSKCVSQAGYIPAGFIHSALAYSYRVIDETDQKCVLIVLDIGKIRIDATVFSENKMSENKSLSIGINDLLDENKKIKKDKFSQLVEQLKNFDQWGNVSKILLVGEGVFQETLIEEMERSFDIPTKVGFCAAKPFEELPLDRTTYASSLGAIDFLKHERAKKRIEGNLFKHIISGICSFLDKYF